MTSLESTLAELHEQRSALVEKLNLLDQAITSLERLADGERDTSDRNTQEPDKTVVVTHKRRRKGPGTSKAVKTILGDAHRALYDDEILVEMQKRDWAPPSPTPLNALRATLSRLNRKGEIVRDGDEGPYQLPDQTSDTPNGEPGVSDHSATERTEHDSALTE